MSSRNLHKIRLTSIPLILLYFLFFSHLKLAPKKITTKIFVWHFRARDAMLLARIFIASSRINSHAIYMKMLTLHFSLLFSAHFIREAHMKISPRTLWTWYEWTTRALSDEIQWIFFSFIINWEILIRRFLLSHKTWHQLHSILVWIILYLKRINYLYE